jgi:hypothetical protein
MLLRGPNLGTAAGANVAGFSSTTGPTFVGQTGITGLLTKGVLPWMIVDTSATGLGSSFATTDSFGGTTGNASAFFRPLAASETVTAINYGAVANTVLGGAANTLQGTFSLNSLNLASGAGLTINAMQTLTLSSGGLLAQRLSAV